MVSIRKIHHDLGKAAIHGDEFTRDLLKGILHAARPADFDTWDRRLQVTWNPAPAAVEGSIRAEIARRQENPSESDFKAIDALLDYLM